MHHDLDADARLRYTQTIHGEAQRLTALVDDFLDLQRIEAGRFTLALDSFDLGELLEARGRPVLDAVAESPRWSSPASTARSRWSATATGSRR